MESLGRAWAEANVVGSDFPAVAPRPFRREAGCPGEPAPSSAGLSPAGPLAHRLPFVVDTGEGPPGPRALHPLQAAPVSVWGTLRAAEPPGRGKGRRAAGGLGPGG